MTPHRTDATIANLHQWNGVRAGLLGVAAAVLLACALPSAAGAQVVNTTTDKDDGNCGPLPVTDCSLREAVLHGLLPEIEVPENTYPLSMGQVRIMRDVRIRGTGAALATIRRVGEAPARIFEITSDSEVEISHVRITNGAAPNDDGGGILINSAGALLIYDSEVSSNFAAVGGGIWTDGELLVRNSLIVSNRAETGTAGGWGGGVGIGPGNAEPASLVNTTLSDNRTDGLGGGLFTQRTMSLVNVSIVNNQAPPPVSTENGAGLFQQFPVGSGREITALNTLVAFNVNGGCGGTATIRLDSTNSMLDELDRQPEPSCYVLVPAANTLVNAGDAKVAPTLADNGGLTRTHALQAGSLAIDRGAGCPADDQRGTARPQGAACDIGAYEYVPPAPPQGGGGTTQPPPEEDELPEPEAGESVNVLPEGTVKIKLPGRNRFRVLAEGEQLPVGTVVDTLKGRVTLVAAGGQEADFFDGIFRIGQGKGAKPLTTLTLVEALSCPKASNAIVAAKKRKRRLWGDGSGRFRTKGKHSAATVVGTRWLVEDRCTSTLTRVTRGRVSVRDFVKKKTVTVRAGKKYVARSKKP